MPCNTCNELIVFGVGYCPKPCVIMRYCEKHYEEEKQKIGQKCVFCHNDILWAQEDEADTIIKRFGPEKDFDARLYNQLSCPPRREVHVRRGKKGKNEEPKSPNIVQTRTRITGSIADRVRRALGRIKTEDLSKTRIMTELEREFENKLFEDTKRAEFSETLLEEIRKRQSKKWIEATKIVQVKDVPWTGGDLENWTVRHYTTKVTVTLGAHLGGDYFAVAKTGPPPFKELLSSITLTALPKTDVGRKPDYREGNTILMANTTAASTSGHTTALDWAHIGNVGDTFFALFYGDTPANGRIPGFIKDAVYYAQWSIESFGEGWASADWLATAKDSQNEKGGDVPKGGARKGQVSAIIADIFPEAATRKSESGDSKARREKAFGAMENFEIKKHGPMPVRDWHEVKANLTRLAGYIVNIEKEAFVKNINPLVVGSAVVEKHKKYLDSKKRQ